MIWKKKKKAHEERKRKFDSMMKDYANESDEQEKVKKIIKIGRFVIGKK